MSVTRRISKWLVIVPSLLVFQTYTYFSFGPRQLKNKLLPEYFISLGSNSDSIFVRDFYKSDCITGNKSFLTHNLSNDKEFIKAKFKTSYVFFDSQDNLNLTDTTEEKFNLIYNTWFEKPDWFRLYDLYSVCQVEKLQTNKKFIYNREMTYHWFLFFWVPTFEKFETTSI